MKNKKGFTLIELLAVIVILAVIMVIAVPKILDIIESSRNSAADSSLKLVRSAIKTQVTTSSMSSANFTKEDGCYLFDFTNNNSNAQNLSLKNKDKVSGSIKYCNGKLEDDTLAWDGQTENTEPKIEKPTLTIDLDNDGEADIGDTISIGEENFYVIKNDGSIISIFAYYNLNAGEIVKFADESGWDYANNETIPTDYYSSSLTNALKEYSEKITTSMGKEMTARLITMTEIEVLVNDGASLSSGSIKDKADSKGISWIYSSSYWTGSASSVPYRVLVVNSNGNYGNDYYYNDANYGIRPVINISVNDI